MQIAMQILRKEKKVKVDLEWYYYVALTPPTKRKVKIYKNKAVHRAVLG